MIIINVMKIIFIASGFFITGMFLGIALSMFYCVIFSIIIYLFSIFINLISNLKTFINGLM